MQWQRLCCTKHFNIVTFVVLPPCKVQGMAIQHCMAPELTAVYMCNNQSNLRYYATLKPLLLLHLKEEDGGIAQTLCNALSMWCVDIFIATNKVVKTKIIKTIPIRFASSLYFRQKGFAPL